jgi:hypothetical protein
LGHGRGLLAQPPGRLDVDAVNLAAPVTTVNGAEESTFLALERRSYAVVASREGPFWKWYEAPCQRLSDRPEKIALWT